LDVILKFKNQIAQLCYTHLSLMLAKRNNYQRRSEKLFFDDLALEGKRYSHTRIRKYELKKALKEINGKSLPTGIIEISLEKTKDRNDIKVVCRKTKIKPVCSMNDSAKPQVIELPKAEKLVQYFHEKFGRKQHEPARKEIYQATVLIARRGYNKSKFIVEFAVNEASKTKYKMRTFGAIFQYENEAVNSYEKTQKQRSLTELRKAQHEKVKKERIEVERKEKESLDKIYASLSKSKKAKVDAEVKEIFNKSQFKLKNIDSPINQAVMDGIKYKILRELKSQNIKGRL
jgi:hypothetical protein